MHIGTFEGERARQSSPAPVVGGCADAPDIAAFAAMALFLYSAGLWCLFGGAP